jgi:hypothetical protein
MRRVSISATPPPTRVEFTFGGGGLQRHGRVRSSSISAAQVAENTDRVAQSEKFENSVILAPINQADQLHVSSGVVV